MKVLPKFVTTFTILVILASAHLTVAATLDDYPEAVTAEKLIASMPLLGDALDKTFFERIEKDPCFIEELSNKLGKQSYRTIGPVPSVRVGIKPGYMLEYPCIMLEYQTSFHGIINIGGGKFRGDCVLVPGGRDAYSHRTFFGVTEDPNARQTYLDLWDKRMKMRSNQRHTMTEVFDELYNKHSPSIPISEIRARLMGIIDQLVLAFKPYGAKVIENSDMGHYGAKITDNLYMYIRDFPNGSMDSKVSVPDPYLWLIFSGGPKPLPEKFLPAFPGAEGLGSMTTGGRGGKVIYVTSLNSDGPGSFAEALNTTGPRIVLFNVSGQIILPKDVWITEPDMTVIGYSAPGEGIEICGRICMAAGNIIMRGMRFRLRPPLAADGMNTRGDLHNIIFDNCSFAYGSDEILRFIGQGHTFWGYTFQYCNIGPGMAGLGSHPYGPEIGGAGSIHHCILQNTLSRSPEVDCSLIDWRNNIMFNNRSGHSKRLANKFNFVNNLIIDNPEVAYRFSFNATESNYAVGNIHDVDGGLKPFNPVPRYTYVKAPFRTMPVTTNDAKQLEKKLLPIIGAFLPTHDATDKYWLQGIRTRKGKPAFWDNPESQWKSYNPGSNDRNDFIMWKSEDFPPPAAGATAPADTDLDGMPDEWETTNKFDPKNPSDGSADADKDGYTNLEEFLYRTNPHEFVDYRNPANNIHTLHTK